MYTGSFASYQGLEVLFEAIPFVQRSVPDVMFVCVGATDPEIAELRNCLDASLRSALRLVERQPIERIATFLSMADILVSTRNNGDNLPIKVIDYIATGKPVLVSDCPAHDHIRDLEIVSSFENSPEALAQLILDTLWKVTARPCKADKKPQPPEVTKFHRFQKQVASIYSRLIEEHRSLKHYGS